jgi:hypothetical protein
MRIDLSAWAGDLARPAPVIAAGVLAVNDHVLKGSGLVPGAVTGKLGDVAGLFVAGIAAVAVARGIVAIACHRLPRRDGSLAIGIVALVAATFALLKLSPPFNHAIELVWGPNVLDPSDLWCLPVLLLSLVWLRDRERHHGTSPRFVSAVAFAGVLIVCAATPRAPPVPPPPVPMWKVPADEIQLACGTATAWVAKSGKTGIGLTVRVVPRAADQPCPAVINATLRFADGTVTGVPVVTKAIEELGPPPPGDFRDRRHEPKSIPGTMFHYLGFEFDNEERWNRGDRNATLELAITAGGELRAAKLPAAHVETDFPRPGRW